jgi:hypothetical protein
MEIDVRQKSDEWFELRNSLGLTASKFGEALGVGRGKPYDFLLSLLVDDSVYDNSGPTKETDHGIRLEPIIDEAYQILTGHVTQPSGLWIPDDNNILHNMAGASPDAKVYDSSDRSRMIGLAEYKAPVYQMYTVHKHPPHSIPRQYMAQIQAQMAISNQPWCDFMAVCTTTRDISLCKVYFHPLYWSAIATTIKHFCEVLKVNKYSFQVSHSAPHQN